MNKFMKLVEIEDGKFNPIGFIYEHTADFSGLLLQYLLVFL